MLVSLFESLNTYAKDEYLAEFRQFDNLISNRNGRLVVLIVLVLFTLVVLLIDIYSSDVSIWAYLIFFLLLIFMGLRPYMSPKDYVYGSKEGLHIALSEECEEYIFLSWNDIDVVKVPGNNERMKHIIIVTLVGKDCDLSLITLGNVKVYRGNTIRDLVTNLGMGLTPGNYQIVFWVGTFSIAAWEKYAKQNGIHKIRLSPFSL